MCMCCMGEIIENTEEVFNRILLSFLFPFFPNSLLDILSLITTLNTSAAAVLRLIKDVANAHIQAFEIPSASGRYCLVERVAHYSEVVKCADDKPYVPTYHVSKEKARSLGIEFIPFGCGLEALILSDIKFSVYSPSKMRFGEDSLRRL
ncbi:hypothetical protein Gotur_013854, partial [Gossypium turneri]